jgi:hypothetical protein
MAYTEPPPDKERRYKMDEDGASINGLEEDISNDIDDIAAIFLGEDEGGEGESGDNEIMMEKAMTTRKPLPTKRKMKLKLVKMMKRTTMKRMTRMLRTIGTKKI